ncbi:hypothetical protein HanIR_Chr06g0288451 [Helianthus annuus]|nr:hypothetical protein HanIR_Chr06g0288451 [Helianthus annuus]
MMPTSGPRHRPPSTVVPPPLKFIGGGGGLLQVEHRLELHSGHRGSIGEGEEIDRCVLSDGSSVFFSIYLECISLECVVSTLEDPGHLSYLP